MINIKKDFANPPAELKSNGCLSLVRLTLTERNNHKFSIHYYRQKTIDHLRSLYNCKCAYCETPESPSATLRVDHYRPKNKIKDSNPNHLGYYWLGYEWSNLLLVCERCNRIKSNYFPIINEANRLLAPELGTDGLPSELSLRADKTTLKNEQPLLLNPELDNVEEHFIFKPDGTIKALTPRGEKSKELYDLARDTLNIARKKLVDKVLYEIKKLLADYLDGNICESNFHYCLHNVYSKMVSRMDLKKQYSRMAFFTFNKFELFIINQLEFDGQRKIIYETFQMFINGNLLPEKKIL